jgi:hypothetical protein
MHTNSKLLFQKYVSGYIRSGMKVLEIGPDHTPSTYQTLVNDPSVTWHTLDICDNSRLTFPKSEEYVFPIPDNMYDVVLTGQVAEHVPKIWVWIKELARVCKTDDHVITVVPVSWSYHPVPVDCWRIYPEGMKALYAEANLAVLHNLYESLETPGYKRYIPGISAEEHGWKRRWANRLLGLLGLPVERTYDTVTIGQKR